MEQGQLNWDLGKKSCRLSDEDIQRICDAFLVFQKTEQSEISPNAVFSYDELPYVMGLVRRAFERLMMMARFEVWGCISPRTRYADTAGVPEGAEA
jgi:hypothetical protein